MNKAISLSAGILLLTSAIAQQKPEHNAVWSVAVSSFTSSMPGATYTKAVFTPVRPIVVRRIEAFGERGPGRQRLEHSTETVSRTVFIADLKRCNGSGGSYFRQVREARCA
jgi:hypothetical protein